VTPAPGGADGPDEPALCEASAIALRFARGAAVALVVVDLATSERIEIAIPAPLRSGTWTVADDDACIATRVPPRGAATEYVIADGVRLEPRPPRAPQVIQLDMACCFGNHALACETTPRADTAARTWIEDDGAGSITIHERAATPLLRDEGEPEASFVRALASFGDGSVRGALWGDGGETRRFVVDATGTLVEDGRTSPVLRHGPIMIGETVVEVEGAPFGDLVTTRALASGRMLATRALDDGGPVGRHGRTLGLVVDDVFVPLDPSLLPDALEPVPDEVADFDCRWPPPCAFGSEERGVVAYMEGGTLTGLDEAAWIGVERAGAATCIREIVTVYGERLALSQSGFVGAAVHGGAPTDAACHDGMPSP